MAHDSRTMTDHTTASSPSSWAALLMATAALSATVAGVLLVPAQTSMALARAANAASASSMLEAGPSRAEVERVLALAGLTPERLAVAGCSDTDAGNIVNAAIILANDAVEDIESTLSNLASARSAVDGLATKVRKGQATSEEVSALASAQATLATREAALASLKADLAEALSNVLSPEEVASCGLLQQRAFDGVPAAYGVFAFSEAALTSLRDALAQQRYCAQHAQVLHEDLVEILEAAQGQEGVESALERLDQQLPAITSAWNERLNTTGV